MGDDAPEDVYVVETTVDGVHYTGYVSEGHIIAVNEFGDTTVLYPLDTEVPEPPELEDA